MLFADDFDGRVCAAIEFVVEICPVPVKASFGDGHDDFLPMIVRL